MKKAQTDRKQLSILRLFDDFARSQGLKLSDQVGHEMFVSQVSRALHSHRHNPALLHGFRAQTMFAYVAAALGACRIINEEDSGDLFISSERLKRPDFRILTEQGHEFFVEVKNFNGASSKACFKIKPDYLQQLEDYAASFGKPLFFAIYWVRWNTWTLTNSKCFQSVGDRKAIALLGSAKLDEMSILGDCLVGVGKPLAMRFFTDPSKEREINSKGECRFTIGRVAFFVGGKEIVDKTEVRLAWFFLHYGNWERIESPAVVKNGELVSFDFCAWPADQNPDQEFELIGRMSQMVSRQFNERTAKTGVVDHLTPKSEPEQFGALIPPTFKGDVLGIWRFTLQPHSPTFSP